VPSLSRVVTSFTLATPRPIDPSSLLHTRTTSNAKGCTSFALRRVVALVVSWGIVVCVCAAASCACVWSPENHLATAHNFC